MCRMKIFPSWSPCNIKRHPIKVQRTVSYIPLCAIFAESVLIMRPKVSQYVLQIVPTCVPKIKMVVPCCPNWQNHYFTKVHTLNGMQLNLRGQLQACFHHKLFMNLYTKSHHFENYKKLFGLLVAKICWHIKTVVSL